MNSHLRGVQVSLAAFARVLNLRLLLALCALASLGLLAPARAQSPNWKSLVLSARNYVPAAYDSARGVTVMFGGAAAGFENSSGETWEWNGAAWSQRSGDSPPPRSSHAMVYDAARNQTLVVGGYYANQIARIADTWGLGLPPIITSQPADQSTCLGGAATFSVQASGSNALSYQWRRGLPRTEIPGATAPTYILSPATRDDATTFDCVISSTFGSITTSAATLSICAADFNCDGSVDCYDYDEFVSAFESGSSTPSADFDADGALDFFDYDAFVVAFELGC